MRRRAMALATVAAAVAMLGCVAADEAVHYLVTTERGDTITCKWFRYEEWGPRCENKWMDTPRNEAITIQRVVKP